MKYITISILMLYVAVECQGQNIVTASSIFNVYVNISELEDTLYVATTSIVNASEKLQVVSLSRTPAYYERKEINIISSSYEYVVSRKFNRSAKLPFYLISVGDTLHLIDTLTRIKRNEILVVFDYFGLSQSNLLSEGKEPKFWYSRKDKFEGECIKYIRRRKYIRHWLKSGYINQAVRKVLLNLD